MPLPTEFGFSERCSRTATSLCWGLISDDGRLRSRFAPDQLAVRVNQPALAREIGRWGLTALTVNCVVGAGILGLPGRVYTLAGNTMVWVLVGAALLAVAAALCLAELASRFDGAGGPAEYCRDAFGPAGGFAAGWLSWTATVLAAASLLTLFADLVAPGARVLTMLATGASLTGLAMTGAGRSSKASAVLTAAKLLLLGAVAIVGLLAGPIPAQPPLSAPHPASALVLLFFAFVGFERPTAVAGEVKDAHRAVPFALIVGMAAVTILYAAVLAACWRGVPELASSERPVGELAARLFGPAVGATIDDAAALIVFGTLASQWITAPRLLLALAEVGQLPAALAQLSARRHTPDAAILVTGATAMLLALSGGFVASVTASSASRLLIFAGCAAALVRLRRRSEAPEPRFRLPAGSSIATCVIVSCALLLAMVSAELGRLALSMLMGVLLWLITNRLRRWQEARSAASA